MGPDFVADYEIVDLGHIDAVPSAYGGLAFGLGDPSTLLLGSRANSDEGKIMALSVRRAGNGTIIGFDCAEPTLFGVAPFIDGGIDFAPNGTLLYTTYPTNTVGQLLPGSTSPDLIIALDFVGVLGTTGALTIVPAGFPGEGRLKIVSYSWSHWYDAVLTPNGDGTWGINRNEAVDINLTGGPEGIAYVHGGSPGFPVDSVLISMYGAGEVWTYAIDFNGDPIIASKRVFMTALSGAEGAVIDPVTGDFLFTTFGGVDRILKVSGFGLATCTADFDDNGEVDGSDLGTLLGEWGSTSGGETDLSGDCAVDGNDLGTLLGQWGPCAS